MAQLQKATAYTKMFFMTLSSDHLSPATGKTVTVTLSKAGAAFGAAAGSVAEVASGWYTCSYTTVDTGTAGDLALHATATSCDPTDLVDQVIDPAVGMFGANVATWLGTAAATPTVAGVPKVELAGVLAAAVRAFMDTTRAAELSAVPSQTVPSYSDMLAYLFQRTRNVMTETATTEILKKADGTTTLSTATNSDDNTTFTRGAAS